jgi:hypothetical protein
MGTRPRKAFLWVGLVVTVGLAVLAGYFTEAYLSTNADLERMRTDSPLKIEADLAKAGQYEGRFVGLSGMPHALLVTLEVTPAFASTDSALDALDAVGGRFKAEGKDGKVWLESELGTYGFANEGEGAGQTVFQVLRLTSVRNGDSVVTLDVAKGSPEFAGRSYRFTAQYELCGLENLMVAFAGFLAIAGGLTAAIVGAITFAAYRRRRRNQQTAGGQNTGSNGTVT